MKRVNITTAVLLAYLLVMSVLAWPGRTPSNSYPEYFCMIGVTLFVIFLLRYLQIKRFHMREKRRSAGGECGRGGEKTEIADK